MKLNTFQLIQLARENRSVEASLAMLHNGRCTHFLSLNAGKQRMFTHEGMNEQLDATDPEKLQVMYSNMLWEVDIVVPRRKGKRDAQGFIPPYPRF